MLELCKKRGPVVLNCAMLVTDCRGKIGASTLVSNVSTKTSKSRWICRSKNK